MTTEEKLIRLYEQAEKRLKLIILQKGVFSTAANYQRSLLRQIMQELKRLRTASERVVSTLTEEAYEDALDEFINELQAQGVPTERIASNINNSVQSIVPMNEKPAAQLAMSGLNKSQIRIIAENTDYDFNKAINLVGRRIQDAVREAAVEATAEKLTTGQTVRQMQKNLEQKLNAQSLTCVEYANGVKMPLKSYAEMVSRSTTAETQNTAKIVQGKEWGYDLVQITTHSPTCPICAMYQGRVYAITKEAANGKYKLKDGTVFKLPYLYETAFASGYSTIHPNCRHRISNFSIRSYTDEEIRHYAALSTAPFEDTRSEQERKAYSAEVAKRRKLLENRRQYEKIKAVLPDHAPKSLAAFVRMKAANSEKYKELMSDYKRINRVINVQNKMTEQVQRLSQEEKDILKEYSGALAARLNAAIGRGKLTPELEAKKKLLHQALSKGVMPETVTLYRDTCISFMKLGLTKKSTENELQSLIGQTNSNQIFTSTSFSTLDLQGRDTRMYITVSKGYKGCQYIKSVTHSQYRDQEEVLFDAPLTYRISNATIDESGKIFLYVEVLNRDGT